MNKEPLFEQALAEIVERRKALEKGTPLKQNEKFSSTIKIIQVVRNSPIYHWWFYQGVLFPSFTSAVKVESFLRFAPPVLVDACLNKDPEMEKTALELITKRKENTTDVHQDEEFEPSGE